MMLSHPGRYREVRGPRKTSRDPAPLQVKNVTIEGRRYVVCFNSEQAKKDRADREAILKSLQDQLKSSPKNLIGNKGYRKYVKSTGTRFAIDREKVKSESRYDGKWVLQTDLDLPADEVALYRLEQRMGHIHRYGQQKEVMIWNLCAINTREGEVMDRLLRKLDDMRQALGSDRVYDVIGDIIPGPSFDTLMKDWLSRRRTMTEIPADIELQTDEEQVTRIRADMENKLLGSRYIDMSNLTQDVQKSKENRLMPEYIERFFIEAFRSFGGTVTSVKTHKGVWSINRVPPDLRKLPDSLERKYGKIGTTYQQFTFDKEMVVGYTDLEFVGPGHPLFEGVVERVLREYGPSLRQGACFFNADATQPTVMWLLKCGVEDGRGTVAGERLFAIHLSGDEFTKSQPYALLDLKAPENNIEAPETIRQSATDEDCIIGWAVETVTPEYFDEIEDRRTKELAIKEKYVRKSLPFLIGESINKLAKYDHQLRQIRDEKDPKRLNLQGNRAKEDARRNELSQRLKDRLVEIEQERHLSEQPPEVLGVAVILPTPQEVI